MHLGLFAKCTPCWSVSVNAVDKSSGRTGNCPVDSRIGVEKRDYHHLSRFEIAGGKRIINIYPYGGGSHRKAASFHRKCPDKLDDTRCSKVTRTLAIRRVSCHAESGSSSMIPRGVFKSPLMLGIVRKFDRRPALRSSRWTLLSSSVLTLLLLFFGFGERQRDG